jgi:hypothetical protein
VKLRSDAPRALTAPARRAAADATREQNGRDFVDFPTQSALAERPSELWFILLTRSEKERFLCNLFSKSRIRDIPFPVAGASPHGARRRLRRKREWALETFSHNRRRELENWGKFFIPIACNPLKSPDSEK